MRRRLFSNYLCSLFSHIKQSQFYTTPFPPDSPIITSQVFPSLRQIPKSLLPGFTNEYEVITTWCAWQDLNLRLSAPEADVLSAELQAPSFVNKRLLILIFTCFLSFLKWLNSIFLIYSPTDSIDSKTSYLLFPQVSSSSSRPLISFTHSFFLVKTLISFSLKLKPNFAIYHILCSLQDKSNFRGKYIFLIFI